MSILELHTKELPVFYALFLNSIKYSRLHQLNITLHELVLINKTINSISFKIPKMVCLIRNLSANIFITSYIFTGHIQIIFFYLTILVYSIYQHIMYL